MKAGSFVRIIEKTNRRQDIYDGVVLSYDSKEKSLVAICQGPERDSSIARREFDMDDYYIQGRTEEDVKHCFNQALLNSQMDVHQAEFDLEEHKFTHRKNLEHFNSVFHAPSKKRHKEKELSNG